VERWLCSSNHEKDNQSWVKNGRANTARPFFLPKKIIFLCRKVNVSYKESSLINQLLRSGTSIGANIHEAQYAQGTKDFISKLEIAQKECYESEYWLELLYETDIITESDYIDFKNDCGAIRRMLISSLKTIKANQA
jgi:four helix bundle protein